MNPRIKAMTQARTIPVAMLRIMAALLFLAMWALPASAATILPKGETTFLDDNGDPLSAGSVYFYIPSTTTLKNTWQDEDETTLNTNPVVLDSAGRAVIFGSGSYRQIVKDSDGNTIWDRLVYDTSPDTGVWWGSTSGGAANVQTATASGFVLAAGNRLSFIAGYTNTGATTLNVNAGGAVNVYKTTLAGGLGALDGGEIVAGQIVDVIYDGSQYQLINFPEQTVARTADTLASAATTDLGSINVRNVDITGTTTITAFGTPGDTTFPIYWLKFSGALTLTHNATSLILPGGLNIQTAAGDTAIAEYLGSGNWRVRQYTYANPPVASAPQGRLTLTTATPVLTSDVTAAGTVYYTPYLGNSIPIWNGSVWINRSFSEMSIELQDPEHTADTNYDVFAALDSGTMRICTGPAWSSSTARGTGAATTEIERILGFWTNAEELTTCRYGASTFTVAAGYGTYLGTFRTTATVADTEMTFAPSAGSGGSANKLYVWNAYNRVQASALMRDNTNSWNSANASWRAANNSSSNRVSFIRGLDEDHVSASYQIYVETNTEGAHVRVGVGLDSTSAISGVTGEIETENGGSGQEGLMAGTIRAEWAGVTGIGLHYISALEEANSTTPVFYGDDGAATSTQMGLIIGGMW